MFATIIKEYRKSINISQEEMAYKLDISANHLSRIERKKVSPSGELINRIIRLISDDHRIMNLEVCNLELLGIILLVYMHELDEASKKIVFEKTISFILDVRTDK